METDRCDRGLVGGGALGGVIGFVGLVPHLVRLMFGCENRYLFTIDVRWCEFSLISDLIARTALNAAELPLGVVTTTIGAPYLSGWYVIMIQVKNLSVLERLQPLSFQVGAGLFARCCPWMVKVLYLQPWLA